MKKNRTLVLDAAGVVMFLAALVSVTAWSSCAGPSPWLKPQGELVQLERQAAGAKALATDGRTRAALDLCITSAQSGVHAIDRLLGEQEKLRQARKAGAAIPELERSVARATTDAGDAEAQARTDCRRAGVAAPAVRAERVDAGADGGPPPDGAATAAPAPPRDLPSPRQPPAPSDMAPAAPADGGPR